MSKTERNQPEGSKRHRKKRKTRRSNWTAVLTQLIRGEHGLDGEEVESALQELLRRHHQK